MITNIIIMVRLIDGVRGAGLEQGTNGKVSKEKVNEMLGFFNKAFWKDVVLSVWWFDQNLVEVVKENENIIKWLLQSELERDYRYELNVNLGAVEEVIEWIDIINNNQDKNGWIIWKQLKFTTSVIEGLIAFLKIYQSSNIVNQNENWREKEIILILIVKTLRYSLGSSKNGFTGIKSELFSKLEAILHRVLDDADIGTDEKMQLIFQANAGSYGNAPEKNKWIEDFIRSISGDEWSILVHFLKKSQINKNEILLYLDRNIVEVIIEFGANFIFILSNQRDWKKDSVLLYKTTENILQEEDTRKEKIEKVINLFLQWWIPFDKIEWLAVVLRKNMIDRKPIAEDDFYKAIQSSYYGG